VDDAGNIIGRRCATGAKRVLLVGSHLDTVPNGGRYDGVLGVMIAIAVANELGNAALPFHLDVIGFSEEEGVRYGMPYLGSSAVAGQFQPQWLERTDANGVAMRDAIATFGLDPARIEQAPYRRDEVIGFVEPHLEQGPILDGAGAPVGVVTAIAGQSRLRLEYSGESGHAGATPMGQRRDALVSAAQFVAAVRAVGRRIDGLRATIGRLLVEPGASNVIPGRVELSLDLRHVDDAVREAVLAEILEVGHRIALSDDVSFRVLEQNAESAVAIDGKLRQQIEEAVADVGCKSMHLASWAGHDAVAMAKLFPIAMLFVRHPGAVSHHPDERVESNDVAVAIEVLIHWIARLAEQERWPSGESN
jgi:allantoate deiminase